MPTDPLPMIADPAGGPTPVFDIEALLGQVEEEAEEWEDLAGLSPPPTIGGRHTPDK